MVQSRLLNLTGFSTIYKFFTRPHSNLIIAVYY
nr:MAG TPA: hypothetical protein [Caudoviricetes sp.]